jgi:hypothetical protein
VEAVDRRAAAVVARRAAEVVDRRAAEAVAPAEVRAAVVDSSPAVVVAWVAAAALAEAKAAVADRSPAVVVAWVAAAALAEARVAAVVDRRAAAEWAVVEAHPAAVEDRAVAAAAASAPKGLDRPNIAGGRPLGGARSASWSRDRGPVRSFGACRSPPVSFSRFSPVSLSE